MTRMRIEWVPLEIKVECLAAWVSGVDRDSWSSKHPTVKLVGIWVLDMPVDYRRKY